MGAAWPVQAHWEPGPPPAYDMDLRVSEIKMPGFIAPQFGIHQDPNDAAKQARMILQVTVRYANHKDFSFSRYVLSFQANQVNEFRGREYEEGRPPSGSLIVAPAGFIRDGFAPGSRAPTSVESASFRSLGNYGVPADVGVIGTHEECAPADPIEVSAVAYKVYHDPIAAATAWGAGKALGAIPVLGGFLDDAIQPPAPDPFGEGYIGSDSHTFAQGATGNLDEVFEFDDGNFGEGIEATIRLHREQTPAKNRHCAAVVQEGSQGTRTSQLRYGVDLGLYAHNQGSTSSDPAVAAACTFLELRQGYVSTARVGPAPGNPARLTQSHLDFDRWELANYVLLAGELSAAYAVASASGHQGATAALQHYQRAQEAADAGQGEAALRDYQRAYETALRAAKAPVGATIDDAWVWPRAPPLLLADRGDLQFIVGAAGGSTATAVLQGAGAPRYEAKTIVPGLLALEIAAEDRPVAGGTWTLSATVDGVTRTRAFTLPPVQPSTGAPIEAPLPWQMWADRILSAMTHQVNPKIKDGTLPTSNLGANGVLVVRRSDQAERVFVLRLEDNQIVGVREREPWEASALAPGKVPAIRLDDASLQRLYEAEDPANAFRNGLNSGQIQASGLGKDWQLALGKWASRAFTHFGQTPKGALSIGPAESRPITFQGAPATLHGTLHGYAYVVPQAPAQTKWVSAVDQFGTSIGVTSPPIQALLQQRPTGALYGPGYGAGLLAPEGLS